MVPAVLCCLLYARVFYVLKSTSRNRSKNITLSLAFFTSTVFWILLWFPFYTHRVISALMWERGQYYYNHFMIYFILHTTVTDCFFIIYSIVNPVLVLAVCRPFREAAMRPLKYFWGLV